MGFKEVEPYTHYSSTQADQVTARVKDGRRDNLIVLVEVGEEVMESLGWRPGATRLKLKVGFGQHEGTAILEPSQDGYKVRKMRNQRTGLIVIPAAAMGAEHKQLSRRQLSFTVNRDLGRMYLEAPQ